MERAVKEVLLNKKPCRTVATDFGTPHVTLRRYVYKIRFTEICQKSDCPHKMCNTTTAPNDDKNQDDYQ